MASSLFSQRTLCLVLPTYGKARNDPVELVGSRKMRSPGFQWEQGQWSRRWHISLQEGEFTTRDQESQHVHRLGGWTAWLSILALPQPPGETYISYLTSWCLVPLSVKWELFW